MKLGLPSEAHDVSIAGVRSGAHPPLRQVRSALHLLSHGRAIPQWLWRCRIPRGRRGEQRQDRTAVAEFSHPVLRHPVFRLRLQQGGDQAPRARNRLQSEAETFAVMELSLPLVFKSISVDLINGLPFQSVASFSRTLDK